MTYATAEDVAARLGRELSTEEITDGDYVSAWAQAPPKAV